jgi:curved DNA-binding protein CbpA
METKSLYTILGIRPDASIDQIETAYAELLHQLKDGSEASPGGDDRIRLIAAKEAYTVLSNSAARQQYNQKLFAPQTFDSQPEIIYEQSNSWNIPKLLVIGCFSIGAIWVYNDNVAEREKLRIELEKSQIKLQNEAQNRQEAVQQTQLNRQQELQKTAQENALRERALRESRETDYRLQQLAQQEARETQLQQQREDARLRQQKIEAERQVEKEKQTVRWLQNENQRNNYRY